MEQNKRVEHMVFSKNANPNDQYTPYIDIVERTGSKVYEMDLKVRVGDLTGLSQTRLLGTNPNDAGFACIFKNVFLEGGITATRTFYWWY